MDTKAVSDALENLQKVLEGMSHGHKQNTLQPLQKEQNIRNEKVQVFVRVVFLKIGEIKTVEEKFHADVFIQAKWREPLLDNQGTTKEEYEIVDRFGHWNPKLEVENAVPPVKQAVWQMVRIDSKGKAYICERRRLTGTFLESMELNHFPFDTQDLTVTVTSERGEQEVELSVDKEEISVINVQAFIDEQEWYLHTHIDSWTKVTTNAYRNQKHKHPAVSLCCKASRRASFFMWNVVLVMMFICSLVFTTFAVDLTLVQNRLQLSFILLLSNITFKFVVSQSLPKVSYLTILDKYVLTQMSVLIVVCVWHAVIFELSDETFAKLADKIALGVLGGLYILLQLIFFLYWRITIYLRVKEFKSKEKRQEALETRMSMGKSVRSSSARPGAAKLSPTVAPSTTLTLPV